MDEFLTAISETVSIILGFMIFFLVMKKFAWGPILGVLDERQKKIKDGFDEVKRLQEESAESLRKYEDRMKDIHAEAREQIQKAVADGQRVAGEIAEKARAEASVLVENAMKKIELETATARKQMREEVIKLTLHASEALLREKLTSAKDRELVGAFISDLEGKSL